MTSGAAIGPISLRTHATSSFRNSAGRFDAGHQGDIGVDALSLDVVRKANDRGFRHLLMRNERAFDLGRPHPVARHIDHVVDAAGDPIISIRIATTAIAGEIFPG